ncbi:hypothetical protein SAMN05421823_104489 [Catalinimonas alkaloidigena]|uniref:MORN repeat variant n=1 Tax=Catalinimonas alkaloidigena TaxID=1075417 RepID=A0A1G9HP01_9BACT|nr:hypothetical protein SAMN05421823_104489 [Catalinimonas alkaloidigena]
MNDKSMRIFAILIFLSVASCVKKEVVSDVYSNGQVKYEIEEIAGVRNGLSIYYYDNGNIECIISYRDGVENGDAVFKYRSGGIKNECRYKNGELHGTSVLYTEEGAINQKKYYKYGELKKAEFFINNKIKEVQYFEDGLLVDYEKYGINGERQSDLSTKSVLFVPGKEIKLGGENTMDTIPDTLSLGDTLRLKLIIGNRTLGNAKYNIISDEKIFKDINSSVFLQDSIFDDSLSELHTFDSVTAFINDIPEKEGDFFIKGAAFEYEELGSKDGDSVIYGLILFSYHLYVKR